MYTDFDGKTYESYDAYCNSKDLDPDKVGVYLQLGKRTPQNDYEKRLLAEIRELEKQGKPIEFDFN